MTFRVNAVYTANFEEAYEVTKGSEIDAIETFVYFVPFVVL